MIFTKKKNCEEQNAIKFQAWQTEEFKQDVCIFAQKN